MWPFSTDKPAPVVMIRDVLGEEIDRVEGVRDLWGGVDLRGRNWSRAELSNDADGSDLDRRQSIGARCVGTSFARCNLKNANLAYARIEGASFRQADLEGADLLYTDVKRARNWTGPPLGPRARYRGCTLVRGGSGDTLPRKKSSTSSKMSGYANRDLRPLAASVSRRGTHLGREIHAAQEVLEARVGAQTIIAGIDLNRGHDGGVLLISLF